MNNGDGTFAPRSDMPAGNGAHYGAAGDLNGDGRVDVVVPNILDNTISVFFGQTQAVGEVYTIAAESPVVASFGGLVKTGAQVTGYVVQFSGPLDASTAAALAAYRLFEGTTTGPATTYTKPVPVAAASYDAATRRVTLTFKSALPAASKLRLTIVGGSLRDGLGGVLFGDRTVDSV